MVRKNPLEERGPDPKNGRGDINKVLKQEHRDCNGCPSSREETGEVKNVRKN